MEVFFLQLINGLRVGSIYSLIALGYTMVYGIIRLINFAHGDFIMVGGYTLFFTVPLMIAIGMPPWTALLFAIVVCAVVGVSVEKLAYSPVRKRGTKMSTLITAIAMSLFLENLAQVLFGANPKQVKTILDLANIGKISGNTLLTIALGIAVMLALQLFVKGTKMGKSMRAVSEDKQAAILMGVNVNRTISITFAIGSSLAAVAALMFVVQYNQVNITMGSMLGLKAFIAAVFGGIGIIPGAMFGGYFIGMVEVLVAGYINSTYRDAVVFAILILVLIFKPAGLLGKKAREKV